MQKIQRFLTIMSLAFLTFTVCKKSDNSPTGTQAQPLDPNSLSVTPISSSKIYLAWHDNSDNETGFKIECAPGGTTSFREIATVGPNVTGHLDTGLVASTSYTYRVRAYNIAGHSGYTNSATATTPALVVPPAAPTSLAANAVSSTQIDLSWTDNAGTEDGFLVERAPGGTTNFIQIASLAANTTLYQNTGLASSTSYSYRVLAYNTAGNSDYSNTATAATPSVVVPPAAPTSLVAAAVSSTQIDLSWVDNSSNEDGFKVERAPGGTTNFTEIATVGVNVTSYQNTGLTASTSYSYRVRAYNSAGNSGYSNTATATTPSGVIPPVAPTNLTATPASSTQINLSWTDNSTNETGFRIDRAPGGTTTFTEIATVGVNVTSYQNTGLTASTSYSYRVRAYNSAGNSNYSNTATATTPSGVIPPTAPTNLAATAASSTQINLSWTDNSANETGFRIERAPGGTTSFTEIATVGVNVTSYQNTGLTASTSYSYRVRAYNSAGNSSYSNTATATTPSGVIPPVAPTNLTATAASSTQINLSWTDNSANETGFRIERAPGGTTTFTEIATVGVNVTTYQNMGLTASTSYSYRVWAYNGAGNSNYSNIVTAGTQGIQYPPSLTGPSTSTGTFTLTASYSHWPVLASNFDRIDLEQSTVSSTTGFSVIASSPYGQHPTTYDFPLTRTQGTYYYRARVYLGATPGYGPYSSVLTHTVTAPPRRILLKNNMSTSLNIHDIVQVKVASTQNGVYTRSDLLTPDPAYCLDLPGESIAPGGSRGFDITIGNNYYVYIGIGIWDLDNFFCSTFSPWFKRTYFTDTNFDTYYVWVVVTVTGHASGEWAWTISGSYLNGTIVVTPSGNPPIHFSVTANNPIP